MLLNILLLSAIIKRISKTEGKNRTVGKKWKYLYILLHKKMIRTLSKHFNNWTRTIKLLNIQLLNFYLRSMDHFKGSIILFFSIVEVYDKRIITCHFSYQMCFQPVYSWWTFKINATNPYMNTKQQMIRTICKLWTNWNYTNKYNKTQTIRSNNFCRIDYLIVT